MTNMCKRLFKKFQPLLIVVQTLRPSNAVKLLKETEFVTREMLKCVRNEIIRIIHSYLSTVIVNLLKVFTRLNELQSWRSNRIYWRSSNLLRGRARGRDLPLRREIVSHF